MSSAATFVQAPPAYTAGPPTYAGGPPTYAQYGPAQPGYGMGQPGYGQAPPYQRPKSVKKRLAELEASLGGGRGAPPY